MLYVYRLNIFADNLKKANDVETLKCPVCRKKTKLGKNGLKDIPKNLAIAGMLKVVNKTLVRKRNYVNFLFQCKLVATLRKAKLANIWPIFLQHLPSNLHFT